ncbi:MAG: universal stress protein [Rubrivivax sp.]|nr:universal stress protein [Rubrivivax sp.]
MYKRILIVVDQRAVTRAAVKEGVAMATAHGAEVLFFHVLPRYSVPLADSPPFVVISPQDFQQSAMAAADKQLSAAEKVAERAGVVSQRATGSGDDDAHCIADAARKRRCDLIVAASEGRNALLRLLTGSVIPGLITSSPVPVLVVKESGRSTAAAEAAVMPLRQRKARLKAVAMAPMPRSRANQA